jgi:hypothetical protein
MPGSFANGTETCCHRQPQLQFAVRRRCEPEQPTKRFKPNAVRSSALAAFFQQLDFKLAFSSSSAPQPTTPALASLFPAVPGSWWLRRAQAQLQKIVLAGMGSGAVLCQPHSCGAQPERATIKLRGAWPPSSANPAAENQLGDTRPGWEIRLGDSIEFPMTAPRRLPELLLQFRLQAVPSHSPLTRRFASQLRQFAHRPYLPPPFALSVSCSAAGAAGPRGGQCVWRV